MKRESLPGRHEFARQAFTLIELSIVLVVIGLIVGGILAGQDLVKAARIHSQANQLKDLQKAVTTFRLKYNCKPGDCNAGTKFGLGGLNCVPSSSVISCDGNNDGLLQSSISGGWPCETFKFFTHLKAAGLFDSPAQSCGQGHGVQSKIDRNTILSVVTHGNDARPSIMLAHFTAHNTWAKAGLTPEEMQRLDSILDDGLPTTGKVRGVGNSVTGNFDRIGFAASAGAAGSANCINNSVSPSVYNVSNKSKACIGLHYFDY